MDETISLGLLFKISLLDSFTFGAGPRLAKYSLYDLPEGLVSYSLDSDFLTPPFTWSMIQQLLHGLMALPQI